MPDDTVKEILFFLLLVLKILRLAVHRLYVLHELYVSSCFWNVGWRSTTDQVDTDVIRSLVLDDVEELGSYKEDPVRCKPARSELGVIFRFLVFGSCCRCRRPFYDYVAAGCKGRFETNILVVVQFVTTLRLPKIVVVYFIQLSRSPYENNSQRHQGVESLDVGWHRLVCCRPWSRRLSTLDHMEAGQFYGSMHLCIVRSGECCNNTVAVLFLFGDAVTKS